MEQFRLLLAVVLSFIVYFLWNFFFVVPQEKMDISNSKAKPAIQAGTNTPSDLPASPPVVKLPEIPKHVARTLTVDTPFYTVRLSEKGAGIESLVLKHYREKVGQNSPFKEVIVPNLPDGTVTAGFSGGGLSDLRDVIFSAKTKQNHLNVYDSPEEVTFLWASPQGVLIEKTFTFSPKTYLIGLNVALDNQSAQPLRGSLNLALAGQAPKEEPRYGFEGPSALIDRSLEQIKIKKLKDKNSYTGKLSWIAIETRYFLGSIIPKKLEDAQMQLAVKPGNVLINQYISQETTIASGNKKHFEFDLFFGPKSLKLLKSLNNGLDKMVDFGMFDIIAKPCLWLMNMIHDIIPNYGIAIILLTVFIKILLWPLGNKSYKSMNDMKKIQPLMAELREKYKDNKQKMNEELMNLYKIYKINPMGGCLPMVLQIPVFFALYRMLYEAIELRHAPFFGWINDLSAPDRLLEFGFSIPFMEPPYGIPVLTIVMGATMFLQQKMSPPPGDPGQAKMMMFMPVVFTVIFINFSSGLVLYWLINNILSISQQYYILKKSD